MRSHKVLKSFLILLLVATFSYGASAQTAAVAGDSTQPATVAGDPSQLTAVAEDSNQLTAAQLWQDGVKQAYQGRFGEGLDLLRQASGLGGDANLERSRQILSDYLSLRGQMDQQRRLEYEQAVLRVRRSLLAQRHLPVLAEADLEEPLRDQVTQAAEAYNRAGNADALLEAQDDEVSGLRRDALAELDKSLSGLRAASKLLEPMSDEYAQAVRGILSRLTGELKEYRQVWETSPLASKQAREEVADRLGDLEEAVGDSMASLEAMIFEKPWRVGLGQAQLAQKLADAGLDLAQQDWFQQITREALDQADSAVKDADWYSALVAYAGLEQLYPDNEDYRQKVKTTRRHARVLQLYGQEDKDDKKGDKKKESRSATAPGLDPWEGGPDKTDWRELVGGIDADMVEKAISQLDGYYVTAVDFRQAVRGAIEAIRVLVDTPQVYKSFPGLADEALRKQFSDHLDAQLASLDARERVDHLDLTLALNSTLQASERTMRLPTEVLCMEFADGFLGELDEFSTIIWPYSVEDFRKQTMGQFYGVGIQITKDPGEPLKVVSPLPDTPAYFAGIKTGDLILAVDAQATEDLSIDKLIRMITGEKGTKVTVRIKRAGRLAPFDVELVRDEIRIRTVKGWRPRPDGSYDYLIDPDNRIAYIRLTQFTEQTTDDLDKVLKELHGDGVHSIILDLRFNPGGLLRSAADVANEFLRGGRIVSTRGRQTPRNELNADPRGQFQDGNLVVLINDISASAAEIVSGAIKDWHRGLIIGERSYGKGSVQNVISLRRGRAILKLTTAYYYLPSDRLLHRRPGQKDWGVNPDVEVISTPKQTKRWLDIRQKTDLLQDMPSDTLDEDIRRHLQTDLQLNTALTLLQLMELENSAVKPAEPVAAN